MANAMLQDFKSLEKHFKKIVLVDKKNNFAKKATSKIKRIEMNIHIDSVNDLLKLMKNEKIDIVIDLSNATTNVVFDVIKKYRKASYINTSLSVEQSVSLGKELSKWLRTKEQESLKQNMPHIFFTGMNPGVVNVWVEYGIKKFGKPKSFTEFEFDNTNYKGKSANNIVTWCVEDFLDEAVFDSSEIVNGKKIEYLHSNSIKNTEKINQHINYALQSKAEIIAGLMAHEECITLGNKHNINCKYYYAYNQQTMRKIMDNYAKNIKISYEDLVLVDHNKKLVGADTIIALLEYPDKKVYYINTVKNSEVKKMTATAYQVIVGIFAALEVLLFDNLKAGIFLPEDLLNTRYAKYVFSKLSTYEIIVSNNAKKNQKRKLVVL